MAANISFHGFPPCIIDDIELREGSALTRLCVGEGHHRSAGASGHAPEENVDRVPFVHSVAMDDVVSDGFESLSAHRHVHVALRRIHQIGQDNEVL
jgi:hypothetical protein